MEFSEGGFFESELVSDRVRFLVGLLVFKQMVDEASQFPCRGRRGLGRVHRCGKLGTRRRPPLADCGLLARHCARRNPKAPSGALVRNYLPGDRDTPSAHHGTLPNWVPDYCFTLSISFIATLQNAMFPKIENHTITTVMTTGNLRHLFQTLTAIAFSHPLQDAASKVRIFGTVCAAFFSGALLGGLVSPFAHNRALWVPSALLPLIWATLLWTMSASRRSPDRCRVS